MLGAMALPMAAEPAEGALCAEVLVLGAGPAGLAIAAALVEQGVAVALLCPAIRRPPGPTPMGSGAMRWMRSGWGTCWSTAGSTP